MVSNEIVLKLLNLAQYVLPDPEEGQEPEFFLPESALIVPSKFIGDNVLLLPFIQNLRSSLPYSRIDILATSATYGLYETMPEIDQVFLEHDDALRPPRQFLQAQGYDTLLLCRYSLYWGKAAQRIGVPQRIGYDLKRLGIDGLKYWGKCLTHTVPSRTIFDARHQVELYLDILRHVGLTVSSTTLQCYLTDEDMAKSHQWVEQVPHRPRILLHASAGSPGKSWPEKHWKSLIAQLDKRYAPAYFCIGSAKEAAYYQQWETPQPLVNLCGQTTIRESIALLSKMDLVITLDTSVAHMAALAGTPRLIVLYGPTNEKQWRPLVQPGTVLLQLFLELPCRPCIIRTCEHKSCMRKLSEHTVLHAVEQSFSEQPLI